MPINPFLTEHQKISIQVDNLDFVSATEQLQAFR